MAFNVEYTWLCNFEKELCKSMEAKEWQKIITTRRYIQPPMSERLITLWSEGKVVLGEVETLEGTKMPNYNELISCGIWPVISDGLESLDFKSAVSVMMPDGIPVHTVENTYKGLSVCITAFCDTKRKPTAFIKMRVKNISAEAKAERIGFLLRTGREAELVFGAPDLYITYAPDVNTWKNTTPTWKRVGEEYRDGEYFLRPAVDSFAFDEERGLIYESLSLNPGETRELVFALGKGESFAFDYDEERENTVSFFKKELTRVTKLPESLKKDAQKRELVNNLVVQLLQCFAMPVGENFVLCRQGGLQRRVWPFEALYVFEALAKLGDFDKYLDPVIDTYFSKMQQESGEIVPLGLPWAMATATALYSLSDYAICAGKEYYERYRERAFRAFDFIRKTRASTEAGEAIMVGLYPPKRSSDCELVFQSWAFTDLFNYMGMRKYLEALEYFGDSRASEVKAEVDSYGEVLMECFNRARALGNAEDGIRVTNFVPGMPADETKYAFSPFCGGVTHALKLGDGDVDGILRYMAKNDRIHEGLYWRMPVHYHMADSDGVVRLWYTTADDFYWFDTFCRLGRKEKAKEVIDSTLKYSITNEGMMVERYHPRNPYFAPWSPNASANGRLLLMLIKYASI